MYSDAASTSFICSFCGSKEPWPNSENILDSEIKYRHKPVEVVNGLVKLGHVYFMEPLPEMLKNTPQSLNGLQTHSIREPVLISNLSSKCR